MTQQEKFRQEAEERYPIGIGRMVYQEGKREGWIAAREFSAAEYEQKEHDLRNELQRIVSKQAQTLFDKLAKKDRQIEQLREALGAAVSVIKQWHNADEVWDIYFNHAPEMKPIRTALENTKNK